MRHHWLVLTALIAGCSTEKSPPDVDVEDASRFEQPDSGLARIEDGSSVDARRPEMPEPEQCNKRWTVYFGEDAASPVALIEDGVLTLDAEVIGPGSVAVRVTQDGLVGDFDAAFRFEGFVPGADGAYARAFVARTASDLATASIDTLPLPGVSAAFVGNGAKSDVAESTSWSGTMRLTRVGMPPVPPAKAGEVSTQLTTKAQEVAFGASTPEDAGAAFAKEAADILART